MWRAVLRAGEPPCHTVMIQGWVPHGISNVKIRATGPMRRIQEGRNSLNPMWFSSCGGIGHGEGCDGLVVPYHLLHCGM